MVRGVVLAENVIVVPHRAELGPRTDRGVTCAAPVAVARVGVIGRGSSRGGNGRAPVRSLSSGVIGEWRLATVGFIAGIHSVGASITGVGARSRAGGESDSMLQHELSRLSIRRWQARCAP
jgi:hypothetical protein